MAGTEIKTGTALLATLLLCSRQASIYVGTAPVKCSNADICGGTRSTWSLGDGDGAAVPARQSPALLLLRKFENELLRKLPPADSVLSGEDLRQPSGSSDSAHSNQGDTASWFPHKCHHHSQ
eukprot:2845400-Rhodomonas_salina.1